MSVGGPSRRTVAHYSATSRRRAAVYDGVAFESVHAAIVDLLPPPGAAVLDVGSGSGRDALALTRLGYVVTAAEPSRALREHGRRQDADHRVVWIDDRLPQLENLRARQDRFAFILCSAVVMHLAPDELSEAFVAMTGLLDRGGRLAVTVRKETPQDPAGLIHSHSDEELRRAAASAGLRPLREARSADALGRANYEWRSLVFEAPPVSAQPDRKSS